MNSRRLNIITPLHKQFYTNQLIRKYLVKGRNF